MVDLVLSLALPFLVALAVGGVVRLSAGPERGARLLGVGGAVGFLAWWLWDRGLLPDPALPDAAAPAVVLAGALAGAALNAWAPGRPAVSAAVAGLSALAGLWLLAGLPLGPRSLAESAPVLLAAAAFWAVAVGATAAVRARPGPALLLLTVAALGLAGVARALGRDETAAAALALAAALAALLPWLPATPNSPGWILVLTGGGGVAAIAGAVVLSAPAAGVLPLAVLALAFLAEPTARRLPAGGPRLERLSRPLWLVVAAALPAGLAVLLAGVMARVAGG